MYTHQRRRYRSRRIKRNWMSPPNVNAARNAHYLCGVCVCVSCVCIVVWGDYGSATNIFIIFSFSSGFSEEKNASTFRANIFWWWWWWCWWWWLFVMVKARFSWCMEESCGGWLIETFTFARAVNSLRIFNFSSHPTNGRRRKSESVHTSMEDKNLKTFALKTVKQKKAESGREERKHEHDTKFKFFWNGTIFSYRIMFFCILLYRV